MTQQDLAVALGIAIRSIARWETAAPPKGPILKRLEKFAIKRGCPEHAAEFRRFLLHDKFLQSNRKLFLTEEGLDLQAAIALVWHQARQDETDPKVAHHWTLALDNLTAAVRQILNGPPRKPEAWKVQELGHLHKRLAVYVKDARQRSEEREEQAKEAK
jgi:transcriptional regulator with XRE-family HTH domain